MKLAIIVDSYPPIKSSAAIMMSDLSKGLEALGVEVNIFSPHCLKGKPSFIEADNSISVFRLKVPQIKDVGYIRRTLAELIMPFKMIYEIKKHQFVVNGYDGIVWYSPSIFHGVFVNYLKKKNNDCDAYLIIRDIFPEWAYDVGLIKSRIVFNFFAIFAKYQYSLANNIAVQSEGNLSYFTPYSNTSVLDNWYPHSTKTKCPINLQETKLANKKIFIYSGNMGIAQNLLPFIDVIEMYSSSDIGFLFIGPGGQKQKIEQMINEKSLENVLVLDEIEPNEISSLYRQCHVGIVSLDLRHKSHNIPGKFLGYLEAGLAILAKVNKKNDIANIIKQYEVGLVCNSDNPEEIYIKSQKILENDVRSYKQKAQALFNEKYTTDISSRKVKDFFEQGV